jgi:hypothetical protein
MKLLLVFFALFSISGCAQITSKTLTIYNASPQTIYLESIEGIHLFESGSGPQGFGGKEYPPNYHNSITSYQTVYVDSLIKVLWLSGDKQNHSTEISFVKDLPSTPLKSDGNILLVFETNLVWSATFMGGALSPSEQDLEKMYR